MGKKLIRLTESDLHRIIKESIYRIITEIDTNRHSIVLYHKSPISCRMSILKKGLLPSVGDSYTNLKIWYLSQPLLVNSYQNEADNQINRE